MVFLISCLKVALGLGALVYSGDKLVENAISLAKKWRIPSAVIAATIVAAGTSAPELVTSLLAAFKNSTDISLGNVIGSNIFNLLAIGGLSFLLQPLSETKSAFFTWPLLLVGTFAFSYFIYDLQLNSVEGGFLVLGILIFLGFSFFQPRNNADRDPLDGNEDESKINPKHSFLFLLLSLAGLILSAELVLQGSISIGKWAGLSDRIIGITIISIGTGLPELVTSVTAAAKGYHDMALANILGSNVFNTLAIPGITASFFAMELNPKLVQYDIIVMAIATLGIGLFFFAIPKVLKAGLGALFCMSYIAYLFHLANY